MSRKIEESRERMSNNINWGIGGCLVGAAAVPFTLPVAIAGAGYGLKCLWSAKTEGQQVSEKTALHEGLCSLIEALEVHGKVFKEIFDILNWLHIDLDMLITDRTEEASLHMVDIYLRRFTRLSELQIPVLNAILAKRLDYALALSGLRESVEAEFLLEWKRNVLPE